MNDNFVTVRQLLGMGLLAHEVLGGEVGLDRPVRMIVPTVSATEVGALASGSLAVFGPEHLAVEDLAADLVLRLGHSAGLAGIIAERPRRSVPLVTRRLADKLAVPLIVAEGVAPAALAATFDPYVRAPEIAGLRILGTTADRFSTPPSSPEQLTRVLGQAIGGAVVLVDAECRYVAGDESAFELTLRPDIAAHLGGARPTAATFPLGGADVALLQPVQRDITAHAGYWLIARLNTATRALIGPIRQSMSIAALAFAVHLAAGAVQSEREGRQRSVLLTAILDQAEAPSTRAVERATALGWRLAGWHTAVQIAVSRAGTMPPQSELVRELEEELARRSVTSTLVERSEGWAFWVTAETEADALDTAPLLAAVQGTLRAVEADHSGLSLCAGVGGAHAGTAGIAESLGEARQACLLALTEEGTGVVEHVRAMSAKRLLMGWYASAPLRAQAAEILAPLTAADPSGELVRTLRRYLDRESSATDTAASLRVHRNTVIARIDRIRKLLAVDLDDPDDRLVLHLATRVAGVTWADESDGNM